MNPIIKTYDLDYQGQGIGKLNDKITFIKGMFANEVGRISIIKDKKNYVTAELVELIEKSPDRISDLSFDYAPLYGLSLDAECLWQKKITKETFKKIANLDVSVNPTVSDNRKLHYRNKITLHTKLINGVLKLGVYREQSRDLIEINNHELALPILTKTIRELSTLFGIKQFTFNWLKHITLRTNEKQVMMVLSVNETPSDLSSVIELFKPYADSLYINHSIEDYEILGADSIHIYGLKTLPLEFNHVSFNIGPSGFFQVNTEVAKKMYDHIKANVRGRIIIDAYAGMASIGQYISNNETTVYAIESNEDSIIQAKASIIQNKLSNIEIIQGQVEEKLEIVIPKSDVIIFDPPRSGLSERIIDMIIEHPIKQIVYVSCDLKTLARDMKKLSEYYVIQSITPFRMFPSTYHVENITLLSLKTS